MYRYTNNSKYLSNKLREEYEENGYIVIRGLVNNDLLDECKQRFIDYCEDKAVNPIRLTKFKDRVLASQNAKGEYLHVKLQDIVYDKIFFKYIKYEPLVDIVESIIGPNITACHSMLINKPPDSEKTLSEHPVHQDLYYFPFRPANSIVASWTAMEAIDEKNGCLFVVPGSHTNKALYPHGYNEGVLNNPMYHAAQNYPKDKPAVNLCMEKGDTVFFHPLLLHGSGPNLTKGFRKAISCHYADSNCEFVDLTGTLQENIKNEIQSVAKKKFNVDLPVSDIWKAKSRLVRGRPGNFQTFRSKM